MKDKIRRKVLECYEELDVDFELENPSDFTDSIGKAIEFTLDEVNKIIDKLGETRDDNNALLTINFGEDFVTNSVKMLKEKLKKELTLLTEEKGK